MVVHGTTCHLASSATKQPTRLFLHVALPLRSACQVNLTRTLGAPSGALQWLKAEDNNYVNGMA
jgi:hypothetical protein